MSRIGEAFVEVVADTSRFAATAASGVSDAMDGVTKNVRGQLTEMSKTAEKAFKDVGKTAQESGKTLSKNFTAPIVGAVSSVVGLALGSAKSTDEMIKNARQAGISTEAYQELSFALERSGIESGTFDRLLARNNQRLGRAAAGSDSLQEAYESLGVSIHDSNGELRDSEAVFDDVLEGLAAIEDPAVRAAAAGELLGTNAGRELAGALDGGIDALNEQREAAHEFNQVLSDDAIDGVEEFNDRLDSLRGAAAGAFTQLGLRILPALEDLMPIVEDSIIPAIGRFTDRLGELVDRFRNLDESTQRNIIAAVGIAAALGPVLIVVGKVIGSIGTLIKVFRIVTLTTPIGIIMALVGALVLAFTRSEAFRERVVDAFETVRAVVQPIIDRVTELLDGQGDTLENLRDTFEEVWGRVSEVVETAADLIMIVVETALEFVTALWDRFGSTIIGFVQRSFGRVKSIINGVLNVIMGIFNVFAGLLTGDWTRLFEGLRSIFQGLWDTIRNLIRIALDFVITLFRGMFNAVVTVVQMLWDRVTDLFFGLMESVSEIASNLRDNVVKFVTRLRDRFVELVTNVRDRVVEFFTNLRDRAVEIAGRLRNAVVERVETLRDRVVEFVTRLRDRFVEIVENLRNRVVEFFQRVRDRVVEIVTGVRDTVVERVETLRDRVVDGVETMRDRFVSAIRSLRDGVKAPLNGVIGFFNAVLGGAERVVNGIGSAINRIPSFTVPDWVPAIGGSTFSLPNVPSVSVPRIPQLADGGIAVGPTLAMVGEGRGPEAIIPLDGDPLGIRDMVGAREVNVHVYGQQVAEIDEETLAKVLRRQERLEGVL